MEKLASQALRCGVQYYPGTGENDRENPEAPTSSGARDTVTFLFSFPALQNRQGGRYCKQACEM